MIRCNVDIKSSDALLKQNRFYYLNQAQGIEDATPLPIPKAKDQRPREGPMTMTFKSDGSEPFPPRRKRMPAEFRPKNQKQVGHGLDRKDRPARTVG